MIRTSAVAAWERAKFAWDGSGNRVLATARHLADTAVAGRTDWQVFRAGPLRIGYGGYRAGQSHVLPFLRERARAAGLPTGPVTEEPAGHPFPDVDVLLLGCSPRRAAALPSTAAVVAPFRVHLVLPTTEAGRPRPVVVSRKERQRFARERDRRGWELEETRSGADLTFFYHRMHVPTMARRHGDDARSVGLRTARDSILARGVLFFVTENGERRAGMLCRRDAAGRRLTLRLAGVLDGAAEHYDSGIFMATYLLITRWANDRGIERLDLSGTEPFLSKGILQFKRKLHPRVELPPNHFARKRLWLGVRRDTPAVRDLLAANPVLVLREHGRIEAVYFHDARRPARTDLRWGGLGLDAARYVNLDEFLAGLPSDGGPR
ncbi:hypothetical protein ABZ371_13795 [Streptomyces sp. NPDC005899]|uniref:hypothetical protein n=1 Tax=Streptomyces sp. NPDC005899 TaxID=3155716 RepID=UPI0033F1AD4A